MFCPHSAEIDQKLQEIMKQTGYLKIDGQVSRAEVKNWNEFTSFLSYLQPHNVQPVEGNIQTQKRVPEKF